MAVNFYFKDSVKQITIAFTTGEFYTYQCNEPAYSLNRANMGPQIATGFNFGQILALGFPTMGLGGYTKVSGPPAGYDLMLPGWGVDEIPGPQGTLY